MLHTPRASMGVPAISMVLGAAALLLSVLLAACALLPSSNTVGGGGVIPVWQFRWSPAGGSVDASTDPQTAFARAGRAEQVGPGGATESVPPAVVWLAAGRTFGEVVVQLDPAGSYWNLVTLLIDTRSQTWQAYAGDLPQPARCGSGKSFTGSAAPFGSYCTLEPVRSGTPPQRSVTLWTTPDARTFIAARIAAVALPPSAGAATGVFAGHPGWLLQAKGWTVIVTLLPAGETAVFAGTGDPGQCQQLGVDFLRLGADPASLR